MKNGDKIEDLVKQRDKLAKDALLDNNPWKPKPEKNVVAVIFSILVPVIIVTVIVGICICKWRRNR